MKHDFYNVFSHVSRENLRLIYNPSTVEFLKIKNFLNLRFKNFKNLTIKNLLRVQDCKLETRRYLQI